MRLKSAFTLIELLVIILIIGTLATLATTSLKTATLKARDGRRVSDINAIRKALEIYKLNNEVYPAEAQFILGAPLKVGNDTLISKLPTNPKNIDGPCGINEYLYQQDNSGQSYHIYYCLGQKVQEAGPGPCIATPASACGACSNGSCANKCGGHDGCGQSCPTATCSYPRPYCDATTGNCICRNNTDCNVGQYCSAASVCIANGTCASNNDCGACMKCSGSNTCVNQTSAEDLKNECGTSNCFTGNCSGSGSTCGVFGDNQPHNCDLGGGYANRKCVGNASGLCNCIASACGGVSGIAPGYSDNCAGTCNVACHANSCVQASTGKCTPRIPVITHTQVTAPIQSDSCYVCGLSKNSIYNVCPTAGPQYIACSCCPHGCADLWMVGGWGQPKCTTACNNLVAQGYDDWEWRGSAASSYFNSGISSGDNLNNYGSKTCADNSPTVGPGIIGMSGWQSCTCIRYQSTCPE